MVSRESGQQKECVIAPCGVIPLFDRSANSHGEFSIRLQNGESTDDRFNLSDGSLLAVGPIGTFAWGHALSQGAKDCYGISWVAINGHSHCQPGEPARL
jgi:hypothetical protein